MRLTALARRERSFNEAYGRYARTGSRVHSPGKIEVIATCCFAQPVVDVSGTKIFARIVEDGWQYLVYQMHYESKAINAMILPLPVALPATEDKTVEFISLEKHDDFFQDLEDGFPLLPPLFEWSDLGAPSVDAVPAAAALVVHEVGDFVASFVPTVNDFDRLDPRFRIPKESWNKIPRYADYGFAVFQLKELAGEPHPMAFKFRSRLATGDDHAVFFPTVHIHDGQVHDREHFDHTLYLQSKEFDAACGGYKMGRKLVPDRNTGYVRSKWKAGEFCDIEASKGIVDGKALVHRLDMRGKLENTDVFAKLGGEEANKTSMLGLPVGLPTVASTIGGAGLAWLINRRDKLARGTRT